MMEALERRISTAIGKLLEYRRVCLLLHALCRKKAKSVLSFKSVTEEYKS